MQSKQGDRPERFGTGDALRAVAAVGVLVYHVAIGAALASGASGADAFTDAFGVLGRPIEWLNVALYLFFGLSGYLVGGPFVRAWIDGGEGPRTGAYLRRRAARIAPAFWLVCAYLVVRNGVDGESPQSLVALFAFAPEQVDGPLADAFPQAWTLHVEATFYVLLAAVGALLLSRASTGDADVDRSPEGRRRSLVMLLGAVVVLTIPVKHAAGFDGGLATSILAVGYAFVPGLLLAAYEPQLRARALRAEDRSVVALAAFALAAFVLLMVVDPSGEGPRAVFYLLISGAVVTAAFLHEARRGTPRWADSRPVHALGRWSYGIYLWHVAVAVEAARLLPDGPSAWEGMAIMLPLTLVGSIALGAASWRVVERPAVAWARRQEAAPARAVAPPTPAVHELV